MKKGNLTMERPTEDIEITKTNPSPLEGSLLAWIEYMEAQNTRLKGWVTDLQRGMYINCVYCGHRYGPDDGDHLETMQEALTAHIAECPEHPLSKANAKVMQFGDGFAKKVIELEKAKAVIEAAKRVACPPRFSGVYFEDLEVVLKEYDGWDWRELSDEGISELRIHAHPDPKAD